MSCWSIKKKYMRDIWVMGSGGLESSEDPQWRHFGVRTRGEMVWPAPGVTM